MRFISTKIPSNIIRYSFHILLPSMLLAICISCKTTKTITETGKKLSPAEKLELTALFIDAIKEKELGNPDKAIGLLSQCIRHNGNYDPAMYEMANLLNEQHQFNEALLMANEAVHLNGNNIWYQQLLAEININLRKYDEAAKILKSLADKHSDEPDYAFDLANVFILAKRYTEAVKTYDDIEKNFGVSEETSLQKEKLYVSLGKPNKAVEELERLVKQFPDEVRYLGLLAELYNSIGNTFKSLEIYQRILSINPNDPYIHLSLSNYYRSQNNDEKAMEEMKLAFGNNQLGIDDKIRILLNYFMLSESRTELKAEAYELLDLLIKTHSNEAKAWSVYGDYLYRDKRLDEARIAFRKVNAIDSSKFVVWQQLLDIESQMNDYSALLNESARTIELFPEQPEPYLFNGYSNERLGHYNEAIKSLKAGLGFAVDNELIEKLYTNLGEAYYKKKDYDLSFEAFEKALKVNPHSIYVLNNYSYYLAVQNQNLDRAEEMARSLNELIKDHASYEDTYAWVLFKKARFSDAKIWLEKALSHGGGTNAAILEHYGDILFKLKDDTKAVEYWKKAKDAGGKSDVLNRKINDRTWYEE